MKLDSSQYELTAVRVRDQLVGYDDFRFKVIRTEPLAPPLEPIALTSNLFRTRRTLRIFHRPTATDISTFLHLSARECLTKTTTVGEASFRPTPSAGARHPLDILLVDLPFNRAYVYDALQHALNEVASNTTAIAKLVEECERLVDIQDGFLLWILAQPGRTLSKYEHGEHFVLLDAGAAIATFSLSAHALGLSYCPLGISGDPWVSQLIEGDARVLGIAGGVFGRKTPN